MDHLCRIDKLMARAERIGFPLQSLCAAARVSKSSFYRWQQPDANPGLRKMNRALDLMETALAERERQIVAELAAEQHQSQGSAA